MSRGQRQVVYVWRTEAGGVCLEDRGRWCMCHVVPLEDHRSPSVQVGLTCRGPPVDRGGGLVAG